MTITGHSEKYCYETLLREYDWDNDDLADYTINRGADGIWTLTTTEV
jgi:hypothetical protein|tara:strand:+ start:318 stop:458 length:141 start_codon:yes stop_codon:yes gene_type:complete